jgi:hypothetical protein
MLERVGTPNLRVQFSGVDALTPWERRDARHARYFAPMSAYVGWGHISAYHFARGLR